MIPSRYTSRFNRNHSKGDQARQGVVATEVAICLPILILILFAVYEFAHVNMVLHATESAAYEAARAAIIPGATVAETRNAAQGVLNSVGVTNFSMSISPALSSNSPTIRVDLEVPFRDNSSVLRWFVADPVFRGRCEMAREKF